MNRQEKNILFITDLHLWSLEKGKGGKAFINTVEGYKNAGWNIWFISTGGGIPEGVIDSNKLYENSYPKLYKLWRSRFRLISIFARFAKMILMNQYYLKIGKMVLAKEVQSKFIIYAYEIGAVYSSKKLSERFSFPLITRFQGTIHNKTHDTLINRIRNAPSIQAYKTPADLTIMTNDGTQGLKTLERFNNKSKEVLFWRNGVANISDDIINKRKLLRDELNFGDHFIFLTVSRLVGWKKVERAINAFAVVNKKYPDSRLIILGDGDAKRDLEALALEFGLEKRIIFKGAVEQKLVSNYMVASDVFLSFYDLSNVGNPLMEAMMCKKPIITLDVGDTAELIRNNENGVLLSIHEIHKIPEAMEKLINDKSFADRIASGALETAHKEFWSWEERIKAELLKVEAIFELQG